MTKKKKKKSKLVISEFRYQTIPPDLYRRKRTLTERERISLSLLGLTEKIITTHTRELIRIIRENPDDPGIIKLQKDFYCLVKYYQEYFERTWKLIRQTFEHN